MMALRREQPVEQVEQIAGNHSIEEKRQEMPASADPVMQDNEDTPVAKARKPPPGPTAEELDKHELTHVVSFLVQTLYFQPGHLSAGAVMVAMQSTNNSSVVTVAAVVQTLETWGHTDVVLHADGEPATKSLVRSVANARVHRTLPRHGPPHSHQSQGPVEACIQVYRGIFVANKLALEAGIGCRLLLKHPAIVWLVSDVAWLTPDTTLDAMDALPSGGSLGNLTMVASASSVSRYTAS